MPVEAPDLAADDPRGESVAAVPVEAPQPPVLDGRGQGARVGTIERAGGVDLARRHARRIPPRRDPWSSLGGPAGAYIENAASRAVSTS